MAGSAELSRTLLSRRWVGVAAGDAHWETVAADEAVSVFGVELLLSVEKL
jgi:hypothetical protein